MSKIKSQIQVGSTISRAIGGQLSQSDSFLRALSSSFTGVSLYSQTGTFLFANIKNLKSSDSIINNLLTDSIDSGTGYIDILNSNDVKSDFVASRIGSFDSVYSDKATVGSVIACTGNFRSLTSDEFEFPSSLKIPNIVTTNLSCSNAHFANISGHFVYGRLMTGSSAYFSTISSSNIYSSHISSDSITGVSGFFTTITGGNIASNQISTLAITGSSAFFDSISGKNVNVSSKISTNSITGDSAYFNSITGNVSGNTASFSEITGFDAYISSSIKTNGLVTSGGLSTYNIFSPTGSVTINNMIGNKLVIGSNTWNPSESQWSSNIPIKLGCKLGSHCFLDVSDDIQCIGSYNSQPNSFWEEKHLISKDKGVTWNACVEGKNNMNGCITVSRDGSLWIATRISTGLDGGIYRSTDGNTFSKMLSVQMIGILTGSTFQCCCISPNNKVCLVCLDSCRSSPNSRIPFYISLNNGITWKTSIPQIDHCWISGATLSYDGKYMLVFDKNGILLSHNYGESWSIIKMDTNGLNRRVSMSHDGSHIYLCSLGSLGYRLSTDYGITWRSSQLNDSGFFSVDCDKTGRLVYLLEKQKLLFSINFGESFTEIKIDQEGEDSPTDIRVSSDGSKLLMFNSVGTVVIKELIHRNIHTGSLTVNGSLNALSSKISSLKVDFIRPLSSKSLSISGIKVIDLTILGLRKYMITQKLAYRAVSHWELKESPKLNGVCWSPELGILCGVFMDTVQISRDTRNWESVSVAGDWKCIDWSSEKGIFIACSLTKSMHSRDGLTWVTTNLPIIQQNVSMCYSEELGEFCVNGTLTSDGANWISTSSTTNTSIQQKRHVCWSSELGIYCCIENSTSMLSSDGLNWVSQSVLSTGIYNQIVWANELNLFCTVGNNVISTSEDGITWTTHSSPQNVNWNLVGWSDDLHILLCVSNSHIGYTFDGITWNSYKIEEEHNWSSVCWVKQLGIFIITSNDTNKMIVSRYVKKFF